MAPRPTERREYLVVVVVAALMAALAGSLLSAVDPFGRDNRHGEFRISPFRAARFYR